MAVSTPRCLQGVQAHLLWRTTCGQCRKLERRQPFKAQATTTKMHRQSPVGPRVFHYEMPYGANRARELNAHFSVDEWRSRAIGRMSWPQSPPQWQSSPVGRNCGPSPVFYRERNEGVWNPRRSPQGPDMRCSEWSPRLQRGSNRWQKSSIYSPQSRMHQSPSPRSVRGPARRRDSFESGVSKLYKPSMLEDPWAELEHIYSGDRSPLHRAEGSPANDLREPEPNSTAGHTSGDAR